jgi:hypothetical protein
VNQPCRATLDIIRRAFESEGVEFIVEKAAVRVYGYASGKPIKDRGVAQN